VAVEPQVAVVMPVVGVADDPGMKTPCLLNISFNHIPMLFRNLRLQDQEEPGVSHSN